MALVVLSGQPCSGKSSVAAALKQLLEGKGLEVIIIDEPGLSMKRNLSYKGKAISPCSLCNGVYQQQL
jgi:protein KTI12